MASIGEENFHATEDMALEQIYKQLGEDPEQDVNYRLLKPAEAQKQA